MFKAHRYRAACAICASLLVSFFFGAPGLASDAYPSLGGRSDLRQFPSQPGDRPLEKGAYVTARAAERIAELRERFGESARAVRLDGDDRPCLFRGLKLPIGPVENSESSHYDVSSALLRLLREESSWTGLQDPEHTLALRHTTQARGLRTLRYRQLHGGFPVIGGELIAQVSDENLVRVIVNRTVPKLRAPSAALISREDALQAARLRLRPRPGTEMRLHTARLAVIRLSTGDHLAWDYSLRTSAGPFRVLVDAQTGSVLAHASLLRHGDCAPAPRGTIFIESPAKGPATTVDLSNLDCQATRLAGDWVHSFRWLEIEPFRGDPLFDWGIEGQRSAEGTDFRTTNPFQQGEVTAFQHASEMHDYFGSLGFRGLDRPLPAVSNAIECYDLLPCEGAFYDPTYPYSTGLGLLLFGFGTNISFALEADVVCHEYTHGVVAETSNLGADVFDPQVFFSNALNEAFADYFSCTYIGDPDLGEYSGATFGTVPLRELDNDLHWPEDIDHNFYHDTGQIWGGALWSIRQALSNDGALAAGIGRADDLAYATLVSLPSNAGFPDAAEVLVATAESLDYSAAEVTTVRDILVDRGLLSAGDAPPLQILALDPSVVATGDVAAVTTGDLRMGNLQYQVEVPSEASAMVVELVGSADLDLYCRFSRAVENDGSVVSATFSSEGPSSVEMLRVDGLTSPPLTPGRWLLAIGNRASSLSTYELSVRFEFNAIDRTAPLFFDQPVSDLISAPESLAPLQYEITVEDGTDKELAVSLQGSGDVDLWLRHGQPIEFGSTGQLIADVVARTPASTENLVLDALTVPSLRDGQYFLAVRSADVAPVDFTLSAELRDHPPIVSEDVPLAPDTPLSGDVDTASTGVSRLSPRQFVLSVPGDATRIHVRLNSPADLSIHARSGARVESVDGALQSEHEARQSGSDEQILTIDLLSEPPLREGDYHFAMVNHDLTPANFDLEATVETDANMPTIRTLTEEVWLNLTVPGSATPDRPELYDTQYRFTASSNSPGIDILTQAFNPGDVDVYLRRGRPVQMIDASVVADHRAETELASESITVFEADVVPGEYYVAFLPRTSQSVDLRLLGIFTGNFSITVPLFEGRILSGGLDAANGGCIISLNQFVVDVPANALGFQVFVTVADGGSVDILHRFGSRIVVDPSGTIFDGVFETRQGTYTVEGADLRAGRYYFALGNCEARPRAYDISATVLLPGRVTRPLSSGLLTAVTLEGSSATPHLHGVQYTIEVPTDFDELVITAWGDDCASADVDVFVSREGFINELPDGSTDAMWSSERRGEGAEVIQINPDSSPPLRAGRYWIALINRERTTTNVRVAGTFQMNTTPTLTSGVSVTDTVGRPGQPGGGRLHNRQYRIHVPEGATSLQLDLRATQSSSLDIDLLARYGLPIIINAGSLVADAGSTTLTGIESLQLPPNGNCLPPGDYYVAIGNFAPQAVEFELTATVEGLPALEIVRGDANEDGAVDVSDAIGILGMLFLGTTPLCQEASNANADAAVDISDPLVILTRLFLGGPPPAPPFPDCGVVDGGDLEGCTGQSCL